jgi:hypothetical protein
MALEVPVNNVGDILSFKIQPSGDLVYAIYIRQRIEPAQSEEETCEREKDYIVYEVLALNSGNILPFYEWEFIENLTTKYEDKLKV